MLVSSWIEQWGKDDSEKLTISEIRGFGAPSLGLEQTSLKERNNQYSLRWNKKIPNKKKAIGWKRYVWNSFQRMSSVEHAPQYSSAPFMSISGGSIMTDCRDLIAGATPYNMEKKIISVLLVDDDEVDREVFMRALKQSGLSYYAKEAVDMAQAVLACQTQTFDCAIVDYTLPGDDGLTVISQLTNQFPHLATIMVTGRGDEIIASEVIKRGAMDYLPKNDVSATSLKRIIPHAIEKRTLERKIEQQHKELVQALSHVEQLNQTLEQRVEIRTQELKEANDRIYRSEKLAAMGKLASMVGHEIRGPLSTIKNSAFFLRLRLGKSIDQKVGEHVQILEEEVNASVQIVDNILGFARVKEPILTPLDVNSRIQAVVRKLAIPNHIEVALRLPPDLPNIVGDITLIDQVLGNIISNAVQAMVDSGTLTITTRRNRELIDIVCSDTGDGIQEEDLHIIFEPLYSTKSKGTGLGLAVCQTLVEEHGGTMHVESQVHKGTTFTVSFPITPVT